MAIILTKNENKILKTEEMLRKRSEENLKKLSEAIRKATKEIKTLQDSDNNKCDVRKEHIKELFNETLEKELSKPCNK